MTAPITEKKVALTQQNGDEPQKIHPTGLRKLSPKRIEELLFPKKPEETPPYPLHFLIQMIIKTENMMRERAANKQKVPFSPIKQRDIAWLVEEHNGFACLFFRIKHQGVKGFGKACKSLGDTGKHREKRYEFFAFLFREEGREIFVITENRTWEIVRRYTDYHWPREFCHHFLDPRRITHVTRESIFGEERREEIAYPSFQRLELLEARDRLYTKLVLPFRKDSSVFDLPALQTPKHKKPTVDIAVSVQVGQVRIHKELRFGDYPPLLHHLCLQMEHPLPPQILAPFEMLEYLEKIEDPDQRHAFDIYILNRIAQSIKERVPCEFSFCHKYLSDYLYSSAEFLLVKIGRQTFELSHYATFKDILPLMCLSLPDLVPLSDNEAREQINKVRISFDGKKFYPLMDFVEGEIRIQSVAYFRINKCYYRLSGDYLSLVHIDFRRSLAALLMTPGLVGSLPLPWGGQKSHGNVTATAVGGKAKLTQLGKETVSYLDLKSVQADVCFWQLKGEILTNALVYAHRKKIEEVLNARKKMKRDSLQNALGTNDSATLEIWNELIKKRSILKSESQQSFVINPLVQDAQLSQTLDPLCFAYFAREKEGHYNERYLEMDGYIVGDRVCPFGIEIFDILFTTEDTTYIYHVKEGFDLHTRDALDQLTNAAEMIYEARYANAESNVLDEWFKRATNPQSETGLKNEDKKYREALAEQMKKLGLAAFKARFFDKKLVFVYAVLDSHSHESSLLRESQLKEAFASSDFGGMVLTGKKTKDWAQPIFQTLQQHHYLDGKGRLASPFYATTQESFKENFPLILPKAAKERIYQSLSAQASQYNSTIALLAMRRTRMRIKRFNFEFRVCQIPRAVYDKDHPFEMHQHFDHTSFVPQLPPPNVSYGFEDKNYAPLSTTRGDGACALHALNANGKTNHQWAFVVHEVQGMDIGTAAKRDFIQHLEGQIETHLDLYCACMEEFIKEDPTLFAALQESIAKDQHQYDQAKLDLENQFLHLCKKKPLQAKIQPLIQLTVKQQKDPKVWIEALNEHWDNLIPYLIPDEKFAVCLQGLQQANDHLNGAKQGFYTSKMMFGAYQEEVLQSYYHLSDNELNLAAQLYGKKVVLFSEDQPPQVFNSQGDPCVYILHEGTHRLGHYSRLEES